MKSAEGEYRDAEEALSKGNVAEALSAFADAAVGGYAPAAYRAGRMLDKGEGCEADAASAVRMYARFPDDMGCAFRLGIAYYLGRGVPRDYVKARGFFEASAGKGCAKAMFNLGVMFENGFGAERDPERAMKNYLQAADLGNAKAMYNVGTMHRFGRGVPRDDSKALEWFMKAAERGSAKAQFGMALAYHHGRGVPVDDSEAVRWCRLAEEQGLVKASKLKDHILSSHNIITSIG